MKERERERGREKEKRKNGERETLYFTHVGGIITMLIYIKKIEREERKNATPFEKVLRFNAPARCVYDQLLKQ